MQKSSSTYKNPILPIRCVDKTGNDCMELISNSDWKDAQEFFKASPGDILEMNFGKIKANNAKLVIVDPKDEGEEDEQIITAKLRSIHISIYTGTWQEIKVLQTRDKFYSDIIDLTSYLDKVKDDFRIKLEFTSFHKVAFVGIDTSPTVPMKKKEYSLQTATHSNLGDVTEKLKQKNGHFVRITPGEEIDLRFPMQELEKEGDRLSYVLVTHEYYIPVKKLFYINKRQEAMSL